MNKISIITIHFGINHGSALQTYALNKYLRDQGHDCETIDYIPERYKLWNVITKNKIGLYPFVIVLGYFLLAAPRLYLKRRVFETFLKENVHLTHRCKNKEDIQKTTEKSDVLITGSDQVWNYDYNQFDDYNYFLDFARDNQKKIAYAASVGKDSLNRSEMEIFKRYLTGFRGISVREDITVDILCSIGIDAEHVLDPTFLLSKQEWEGVATNRFSFKDQYIAVYVMDFQYNKLIEIAHVIAKKMEYKIFVVSFKKIKDSRIDRQFTNLTPFEFVEVMNKASYVVTNSFHGTAFAINLNKQFISVGKDKYNSRILSLLRMFKLGERYVGANEVLPDLKKDINYNDVNANIAINKDLSVRFLWEGVK